MSRERERKRDEPKKKGIPLADIGAEVIWDDPKLKVPFSSNPFISRMKGKAELNMALSFGLYYNELTKKWAPLTSATISEALIKGRYYPSTPNALTELSDVPCRLSASQDLHTYDKGACDLLNIIHNQTNKLQFDVSNNLKCVLG